MDVTPKPRRTRKTPRDRETEPTLDRWLEVVQQMRNDTVQLDHLAAALKLEQYREHYLTHLDELVELLGLVRHTLESRRSADGK